MQRALWAGYHLAAQSSWRIRQVDGDNIFLVSFFSLQTVSKEKHTVGEDATKLLCQDSCQTLLHTQSSGRGVNLPQTHDFVTGVVFCSTSAVGRGKLIGESAWSSKQKSTLLIYYRRVPFFWQKMRELELMPAMPASLNEDEDLPRKVAS